MEYTDRYPSPLGEILLASDGAALTGLWFEGQKYAARTLDNEQMACPLPVFALTKAWLDAYFSGKQPDFTVPVNPKGSAFQKRVWEQLLTIPYGQVITYGALAADLGCPSARAVGGAVGKNPISLLIPCHRVVGAGGRLTGYAGGLDRKVALLTLEGIPFHR